MEEKDKEIVTSLEECKRIINKMPVEYVKIILAFIQKIEQTLKELEKNKEE